MGEQDSDSETSHDSASDNSDVASDKEDHEELQFQPHTIFICFLAACF